MRLQAILAGLAALATTVTAAAKPPKYFFLQAKAIPGGNKQFNNEYLTAEELSAKDIVPTFDKLAADGLFWRLTSPVKTTNGTFYSLQTTPAAKFQITAMMQYYSTKYANWEPVMASVAKVNPNNEKETGFYVEGTGSNMHLMWAKNGQRGGSAEGDFKGWLICEWSLGVPQLFFLTQFEPDSLKVPSSCAVVDLMLIPLQTAGGR